MIYTDIEQIKNTDELYELILADPPWQQGKGGRKKARPNSSGKPLSYPTMSLNEIKQHLRIATERTSKNAILFLWATDKYLLDAQRLSEELGWKLHTRLMWDKGRGQAPSFDIRYTHEYLLYMYKGKFSMADHLSQGKYGSVFRESNSTHSTKPEISFKIIENLYPTFKKLEMYARRPRLGWDSFGNELENNGGECNEVQIEPATS